MLRLLKADFKALLKWKATIYLLFSLILLVALKRYMNMLNGAPAFDGIFEFVYIIMLIASVIVGLFIYRDYSQNTIRNKIVVGNSRASVYFSKAIVIGVFQMAVVSLFIFIFVVSNLITGDINSIDWKIFWENCVMIFATVMVTSSFAAMISINIKSPIGAMLPMIILFAVMMVGMFWMEYARMNGNRKGIELFQTLPVVSVISLDETVKPLDICKTTIIGFIMSIIMLELGYVWFRKADLK